MCLWIIILVEVEVCCIDLGKFWNIDDFMGNSAIFWTIFLVIWYQLAHREVICYLIDLLWLSMLWPFQWYIFLLYTCFNIVKENSEVEGGLRNFEYQICLFSKKLCIRTSQRKIWTETKNVCERGGRKY